MSAHTYKHKIKKIIPERENWVNNTLKKMKNATTITRNNKMYAAVWAAKNVLANLQLGLSVEETDKMIESETTGFTWSQMVVFTAVISKYGLLEREGDTLYNNGDIPATRDAMSMAHKVPLTKKKFPIDWGTYYENKEELWGRTFMSLSE